MDKREALENIPPEAWIQARMPSGLLSLWGLHQSWMSACFGQDYQRVFRDTDPFSDQAGSFGFLRTDNTYEFVVFSRAAPLHVYELSWNLNSGASNLLYDGQAAEGIEAGPLDGNPQVVCLRHKELGEQIALHVDTLESGMAPARAARETAALEPWRRALSWYLVARNNDPNTFMRRMHQAFRQFLDSVPLNAMTLEHLQFFQAQRLLPESLPDCEKENMPQILTDIRQQQAYFNSPMGNRIPRIFMGLDPGKLEVIDLQALIMMGAVKELRGFIDRELLKLSRTNPEIKRLWNTPNGRAAIMQRPEIAAIMQHPEAQYEQQQNAEKAMRQQGLMNGNSAEVENLLQQQKAMQMMYGVGPAPVGKVPPPPWKIYEPFDPNDPQQAQGGGGFDLLGSLGLRGF